MFRVMNDYLSKISITTNDDIYLKIQNFFEKENSVKKTCVNINYNTYIVDIRMKKFSVASSDTIFRKFRGEICFPYSEMSVRYNEGSRVHYRLASCDEHKNGICMDVIFS